MIMYGILLDAYFFFIPFLKYNCKQLAHRLSNAIPSYNSAHDFHYSTNTRIT